MSDNQKYYYMRLKQDFFETEEMIILESMQDGYLYSNILLKLYLRSLKRDGKLMFNDTIPYSAEVLATVTRHSVGTIEKAMDVFQKLGLVEVMDDGAIYMLQIQEYIGKSSTEAERKKRYRDRIKLEKREKNEALENLGHLSTKESGHLSGHSSTRDRDRDRDRDRIDIKTEVEVEERNGQMSSATAADKSNLNIFEYYQERIGLLDGFQLQKLEEYQVIDRLEPELIKIAIDKAADNSKRSFGYVNSILKSWAQNGIKTVAQQIEEQNNFTSNKSNSDKPKFGPACSKY
ncbi:MAG: phage replisome organizer N-terminal domain-containing protein [Streptococcus thermophilus]|uniref:Primosome component n=2 Tax=Aliceevansviridae TaxID=3044455 RepID=A0A286QNV9_9CAUD|nr:DnaD-like helicase loader [Streptococcus phage P0091]YP_010682021.1 DnaD-like helicase loader [Streptococcus phage P0093]ARU13133.1 primosome component [Streptococcus phage P0094]MDU7499576.1 phage replisome organizer N-terminal domain-containing protein [Streptococcus thermophilus]ARU12986.1 primosome component [Streptococcus phage P0091]ARU13085.1 primosome component [Streptococcus phage P0093]